MQIEAFKRILLMQRCELKTLASREDIAVERVPDSFDSVQQAADRELAITSLSLHWRTLREIDAALERMAGGSFAICRRVAASLECEELSPITGIGASADGLEPLEGFSAICRRTPASLP